MHLVLNISFTCYSAIKHKNPEAQQFVKFMGILFLKIAQPSMQVLTD